MACFVNKGVELTKKCVDLKNWTENLKIKKKFFIICILTSQFLLHISWTN